MPDRGQPSDEPPERGDLRAPWSRTDRLVPRLVLQPIQEFLRTEAAGGILLLLAAAGALAWANAWPASYQRVWETEVTVSLGPWSISEGLREWISDALMALFFFVVGLEIKRELVSGELRDPRSAALPAVGALGGILAPALIYALFNAGTDGARGWGIPMATDIAFAVGVVAILGRRLPAAVKVFLLALAIADDVGVILVIAVFYSEGISWTALAAAAGLLGAIASLRRAQVRFMPVYVVLGVGTWLAIFESGVHATLAGVTLGVMTPSAPFQPPGPVSREVRRVADVTVDRPATPDEDAHHWLALAGLARETVSPLARLESALHPWTSYVVVPLFALANAGVDLSGGVLSAALTSRVSLGIVAGLVVGKALGIPLAAWVAVRLGVAQLPVGVRWTQIFAVAAVAGIGFTVSLFVAGLAFDDPDLLDEAKVGVLGASLVAGALGAVLLSVRSLARERPGAPSRSLGGQTERL